VKEKKAKRNDKLVDFRSNGSNRRYSIMESTYLRFTPYIGGLGQGS